MVDRYTNQESTQVDQAKLSVFEKSEDNIKKFVVLEKILEGFYPELDQFKLENMIRKNDKNVKYLILKHFK